MSEPVELPAGPYCGRCGEPRSSGGHERCLALAELEPPRYCTRCRRRMVVQVLPRGWTARCSEHGVLAAGSPRA